MSDYNPFFHLLPQRTTPDIGAISTRVFQAENPDSLLKELLVKHQEDYSLCRKLMLLGLFRSAFKVGMLQCLLLNSRK